MLFRGGPVSTEGALAVALLRDAVDAPVGFRALDDALGGRVGLVDLDTPVELVLESLAGLRIFAGYAGWGAEQLAPEIEEGAGTSSRARCPTSSGSTRPSSSATCSVASPASSPGTRRGPSIRT